MSTTGINYHTYTLDSIGGAGVGGTAEDARDAHRYLEILNNHGQMWPGLCCWWCTNAIPETQQPLPVCLHQTRTVRRASSAAGGLLSRRSGYQWHGFFCCVACAKAFCLSRHISFAATRMWLAEVGVLPWRTPVRAAPNYLDQTRFGPGTFRAASQRYKPQTVMLIDQGSRPARGPCAGGSTAAPPADGRRTQQLRRKRKRPHDGTLVGWLAPKNEPRGA